MPATTPPSFAPTDGSDRPPESTVGAPSPRLETRSVRAPLAEVLLAPIVGERRAARVVRLVAGAAGATTAGSAGGSAGVTRAELSQALTLLLFEDLLRRVPMAAAYARDAERAGRPMVGDHGAVRSVSGGSAAGGSVAGRSGAAAFARLLEPLGYRRTAEYALTRLGMTGYSYTHVDCPEDLPQFFVSELHPERFSPVFERTVMRVVDSSVDPLTEPAKRWMLELQRSKFLDVPTAVRLLPELLGCFARHHDEPSLDDYEILRRESAEMAWIATEGHQFNHITDRVEDLDAVVDEQRRLGRPLKDSVEVSRSGRVLQTAFQAVTVERLFADPASGRTAVRSVPGSFHEVVQRDRLPGGELDLAFDAGNAQGIFAMTSSDGQRRGQDSV